jgi:L-threonylcarbamoyladenylate synthase
MSHKPSARIYRGTPRNLQTLASRLRSGDLVAVPTETVYGLAANALDLRACRRIFRVKGRPATDPLIVHVHALRDLEAICVLNPAARVLAAKFWPGPLTLVLPKTAVISDVVTAGRPSVAVRMPNHPLFRRLLRLAAVPLVVPSANPFGYVSPTTAEHVRQGLGRKIRYILDGGPAQIGVESTIVDLRDPANPRVLRPGAISRAEIARALGRPIPRLYGRARAGDSSRGALAPGLLKRHYSPRTPVFLDARLPRRREPAEAYLFLRRPSAGMLAPNVFWLDPQGNLAGAARRLFASLRQLDSMGFEKIHVELAPPGGLGEAINDRLRRAAAGARAGIKGSRFES